MTLKKRLLLFSLLIAVGIVFLQKITAASALPELLPPVSSKSAKAISPPFPQRGKVVMVVVDRLTLDDLNRGGLPNFARLMAEGALGLMNCNTAGNSGNPENTYATIGAGAHVTATGTAGLAFNAREQLPVATAAQEYEGRTGLDPSPGSVVHLGIARIRNQNAGLPHPAVPGALGTALRGAGLKTAVLGNADTSAGLRRQVVTITMDENGLVDYGNIGTELLIHSAGFPGGFRTDYAGLLAELANLPGDAAFAVIEAGDLSRLEECAEDVVGDVLSARRKNIVQEIDLFLGQVSKHLNFKKDLLIIVAPTRSTLPPNEGKYLSPVVMAGAGVAKGFLTSPSTKRPGIILNTDLAPTILNFFNLPIPEHMLGRPLQVLAGDSQLTVLSAMQKQLSLTYNARPYLQKGYIVYQLGLLIAGLYCIFWQRGQAIRILHPFLATVMAVPLACLLLPLLPQRSFPVLTCELVFLTLGITLLALATERRLPLGSFISLSLVTAGLIITDTLLDSPLQKTAIMGYDPIVGARFYGIGNEYMGVFIGSLLFGCPAALSVLHRYRRAGLLATGLLFLLAVFLLGNPGLGANMGGVIAASTAFLTTFLLLCGVQFNFQKVVFLGVAVIVLVAGIFLVDLQRSLEVQSHFGRNAAIVLSGGWPEIADIIKRKTEINIKLFRYTIWSRVFVASLGSLALLFYRPVGVMVKVKSDYPHLYKGLLGVVFGSIVALFFNDSGIVAAATTMIFGAPPLIYLVLKEQSATENFI